MIYRRVVVLVVGDLAVVADELEAADHLANGEEAETLGRNNAAGSQLRRADTQSALDEGLGGADAAGLDGLVEVLVEVLEGGGRAGALCQRGSVSGRFSGGTHGGLIFWPWKTILPTSAPTLA